MRYILTAILLTTVFPIFVFAQTESTLEELITTSSEIEELEKKENERMQEKANLLGFILPSYTDNPSYVITFTDPSSDKHGVEIELDGNSFTKITSPYTFPALSIGQHTVKFRFHDKDGNVQLLEYELIIIPRSPIVNSPVLDENSITIRGTALSNSEIIYTLTANAYNSTGIVESDENGDWVLKITPDGGLADGIYTFMAYTRKYGYASNLSSPVTFGVGENPDRFLVNNEPEIFFSFGSLNKDNIISTFSKLPDLIILTAGSFLIGLLLATTIRKIRDISRKNKRVQEAEDIILKKKEGDEEKEKTLRELFESTGKKSKGTKIEEVKKEEVKKEASIINKDMFLRKYKNLDPDTPSGKEKDSKDIRKKIKVSLTSEGE